MKNLFTESKIQAIIDEGLSVVAIAKNDIITPAAKDLIKKFNLKIIPKHEASEIEVEFNTRIKPTKIVNKKIAIGSDHTGFTMKSIIAEYLVKKDYEIIDCGTYSSESCDYPDFAFAVANKVANREVVFGLVLDATGIPSAMTANKVKGIRAATCYNEFSARSAREHNDANILVVGAKTLGEATIKSIVDVFLATEFAGERHQKRLDKMHSIEK